MPEATWRTHRLELDDQTLREWDATVLACDESGIVLDRSAFYPGGGGQPPDEGVLLWGGVQTRIAGARKGDDLYLIPADGDPLPPPGTAVRGAIQDDRRTALMRTHSGLHVLCGVVFRDYGSLVTGGNMEPYQARMDFDLPQLPEGFKDAVQAACNAEIAAGRRIDVRVLPRDDAFAIPDIIRTATNLVPPEVKEVRIVDIVGLDQQADGGTHVASTAQIGRIEVNNPGSAVDLRDQRRDLVVDGLNRIQGVRCQRPKGAFYVFPNITKTGWKSKPLADALLEQAGVAALSGTSFGAYGEGYIRFSYASSTENITEALGRVKRLMESRQ